jgi:uncharacterized membrane-anchored protein YhcB (DUF1043 family)
MDWWLALTTLVIGVLGGFAIARSGDSNRRKAADLQAQLDAANAELSDYRLSVTRHFSRTAELVDALAANSREIYRHLAEGSERLCDSDAVKLGKYDDKPGIAGETKRSSRQEATAEPGGEANPQSKPDDGWYEILPESEEQRGTGGKGEKRNIEEPVL